MKRLAEVPWDQITRRYEPGRNSRCLCGSGRKFKRCCSRIHGADRPATAAFTAFDEERHDEALRICRADITRYTIWHKSHTDPLLGEEGYDGVAQTLLSIDIRALSELVELLLLCYRATNRLEEFPAVTERLRDNIAHPHWRQRLTYYRALAALGEEWDEDAAREVLSELEPVGNVEDADILQLYLDLFSGDLAFSTKQRIIERLIGLAEKPVGRLQYRSVKGLELGMIGDREGGAEEVQQAVEEFRASSTGALTGYDRYRLASSLHLLGWLRERADLQEEARSLYEEALDDEGLSAQGRAHLQMCIAETWSYQDKWEEAREWHLRSLQCDENDVVRILLAECLGRLGDYSRALEHLDRVDVESLDYAGSADYAFAYATIAIANANPELASRASELLQDVDPGAPYFRERRDRLLLTIQSLERDELSDSAVEEAKRSLGRVILRGASRYLLLHPNFFGLGVNLNRILLDVLERGDRQNELEKDV